MIDPFVATKAAVVAAVFAVLFIAERWRPFTPPAAGGNARLVRNGGLWLLMTLASPIVVIPLTAFAADHALWTRTGAWASPAMVVVDFILLDVWAYFVHRAYHRVPLMARLHRPHHLDERLDTTTAVRFHVGEVALSAALRSLPVVLLAMPLTHVVLFEMILLSSAIFHHSNLRLPQTVERAISVFIVTPSIHFVHHHAVSADTNSNFAAVLSVWDRVFRTQSATTRSPAMKLGVAGSRDRSLARLILAPFERAGLS